MADQDDTVLDVLRQGGNPSMTASTSEGKTINKMYALGEKNYELFHIAMESFGNSSQSLVTNEKDREKGGLNKKNP